jgi:hypothetical protein
MVLERTKFCSWVPTGPETTTVLARTRSNLLLCCAELCYNMENKRLILPRSSCFIWKLWKAQQSVKTSIMGCQQLQGHKLSWNKLTTVTRDGSQVQIYAVKKVCKLLHMKYVSVVKCCFFTVLITRRNSPWTMWQILLWNLWISWEQRSVAQTRYDPPRHKIWMLIALRYDTTTVFNGLAQVILK